MRSGGSWYNLPVPSSPEGSLWPDYDAYISALLSSTIIHWLYKLTPSDQAQATMQVTVSLSDLVWRFLACVPLLGAPKNFSPHPEPILRGPGNGIQKRNKTGKKNREFLYPNGEKVVVVNGYIYLGIKFGNLRRMEVINGKCESKRHTEIKSSK